MENFAQGLSANLFVLLLSKAKTKMRKLFTLAIFILFVTECDDSSIPSSNAIQTTDNTPQATIPQPKALQPETQLERPFTKTESGRVIFNNVVDLFEDESLYSLEDNNIIVHSETPLKLTLKEIVFDTFAADVARDIIEDKFIYNVYEIFAHTNIDKVDITLEPVKQDGKSYGKKMAIKGNITRDRALQVLQTYSAMKTFDDYVEFNPETEFAVLGFSRSERGKKFNSEKFRKQILAGLLTGKLEKPYEMVSQPMNVDFDMLYAKLIEASKPLNISYVKDQKRTLADGGSEQILSLSDIVTLSAIRNKSGDIIKIVAQFGFVSDQELILQSLVVLGVSSFATPDADKTFKIANSMIDKIGKKLKNAQGSIKETQNVDGYTVEMTVHKSLGGLSFFSIEKLEKQPVIFE